MSRLSRADAGLIRLTQKASSHFAGLPQFLAHVPGAEPPSTFTPARINIRDAWYKGGLPLVVKPRAKSLQRIGCHQSLLLFPSQATRSLFPQPLLKKLHFSLSYTTCYPSTICERELRAMRSSSPTQQDMPRHDTIENPQPAKQVERLADRLEAPSLDDRTYRVIRLSNQLEALLVHDGDTDKASAALDVNVGNFSDPVDMPGMAHAVEHLLFMGTEKVQIGPSVTFSL